ncbi:uncharacterized protein LOC106667875 [Cimex lectularius]|uniref:Uncharacterized protein n=1 Tax=Cimex lectularius TaxID=79782 RepID=A0A8I6RWS9_CIMLE|nr:uncharacterized protein LOC106667875 [Cimex lectularius]
MLKWAVGQQRRVESNGSTCCRPPFRKPRRRSTGKENTRERHASEGSPRTRDSVYMRLDAVPAALRDVSNYRLNETPPRTPEARNSLKRRQSEVVKSPRKQPCIDSHVGIGSQACSGWMSASKFSLDSARSTLQIEYSPCPIKATQSLMALAGDSPASLYCINQSPSPVELDHKEIPLRPEEKEIILNTPVNSRGAAVRREIARRLWDSPLVEVSPLAKQFNYLNMCIDEESLQLSPIIPDFSFEKKDEDDAFEKNKSRIGSQTNNDRNGNLRDFVNNVNNFNVRDNQSEKSSDMFAPSIDMEAPSELRRQKVIRRRKWKGGLSDGESARKIARSCLTLPNGIPSPFESPAVMCRLRRPAVSLLTLPSGIPSPPEQEAPGEELAMPLNSPGKESPLSITTWESHNMHFLKTPRLTEAHILNDAPIDEMSAGSPYSSKIESDEDAVSSLGSTSLTCSPQNYDGQSRSRRCLTYNSPGNLTKSRMSQRRSLSSKPLQGELELNIYFTSGLLTIHIVRGRNLQPLSGSGSCNAYIKVSMVPCATERTFHRTCVRKDSSNPRFDTKFTLEVNEQDYERRLLVSAWHRDRGNRKSEFLGCMSFAVKHVVKKEINGSYRLLSQSSGRVKNVPAMTNSENLWNNQTEVMANQSESSVEELISVDGSIVGAPIDTFKERRRKSTKKEMERVHEDQIFLRHLELDPLEDSVTGSPKGGRTPFTTTRTLNRQPGSSYGFSIAWTHPPRVERVESGLPADQAGLRPGDYVIFVGKTNVVTLQEEEILQIIKSSGNKLVLEVYRKPVGGSRPVPPTGTQARSSTACSAATTATATASIEITKRRLHLPQVTFNSESNPLSDEECRKRSVYQLLGKEQQYALSLQFGIARFMLPLSERKDVITQNEHTILFQNTQELLRHTEDILELYVQDETLGQSLGRIYQKKLNAINSAYRRYCVGLKKADCLLVEKTRNSTFMKMVTEPPIPRRRPDLTTFIHKPLEHYREMLKLLQTTLANTKVKDEDYVALSKVVHDMQATYREITVESGLMEPDGEGRPLLSLQDLESRLVFTRCKPFVLSAPGRQWIFGGDLSRVEGRAVRPFWALLFTDLLLFAKVSRDRVIFVTEEPLPLNMVSQALFSIRKKATEFRLLISTSPPGEESPAVGGCADLPLTRTPRKGPRRRTVALRAPTTELKAVWQNLIQRQIIYVNTARGGTPASSPMDSPDPLTADSLESVSMKRQVPELTEKPGVVDLIDHRCRQLGKTGVSKESAMHLAQWMKGQLGDGSPETESEPEIWSPSALRRRAATMKGLEGGILPIQRSISRCEEIEISDHEQSTSDSQNTVKSTSGNSEKLMAVCRKCHKTCLPNNKNNSSAVVDINANAAREAFTDENNWGISCDANLSPTDPFLPVPHISVQPPTPTAGGVAIHTSHSGNNNFWEDSDSTVKKEDNSNHSSPNLFGEDNEGESDGEIEEPPYQSLSPCGLKRYGTVSSLEKLDDDSDEDTSRGDHDELPQDGTNNQHFESVGQSIRGWTVRAGTFVVEKMAFFERVTDDSKGVSFIDRYLRGDPKHNEELLATSTSLAGEEECETSGATSGEEVWGTPTSGDSGLTSPNTEFAETVGSALDDAREQLMLDRLLSGMSIMGSLVPLCPVTRGFPQRRRLDPLPEDEEDTSDSTSIDNSEATKSYTTDQGNKSDSCAVKAKSATSTPHRIFNKLRLRRSQSADSKSPRPKKFMEFLRGSKSEEHTSSSGSRLTRLFSRESQDDIPTSMPPDFVQKREYDKTLERRFWKQLRKRRSSNDASSTSKMPFSST